MVNLKNGNVLPHGGQGNTLEKVSDKMLRKDDGNFEGQFPDGVFAIPKDKDEPRIKVRALFNYCEQRGITPDQLSDEEMEQFIEK